MHQYILYQAYGSSGHVNECRYSLLKYLEHYNLNPPVDIGIIIYTDQPAFFESLSTFFHSFEMKEVSQNQINEWKGSDNFTHRAKIAIIKEFFENTEGDLLYFDTDTYITQPVEPVFENMTKGYFYMHEYEGELNTSVNPEFHKWVKFLATNKIEFNNKEVIFSNKLKMWNAGVLGIPGKYKYLLDDILALTDSVYSKFQKHIAEQFAFSYCLQNEGTIKSSEDSIVHYWNLKEFRHILKLFFKKNEEE
ncbi:MAG TPA: hypothetical protein VGO09_04670, partial [Flavisolibacter sp.]|nr:hypothetical protein [Flavisolibacter sp.]